MSTPASIKGLFAVAILFGVMGITLTYDAVARMRRDAVPPFSEGLHETVWMIPPPPHEFILSFDALPGRIGVWGSALVVPVFCGYLLFRRDWLVVSFLLLGLWSLSSGCFGIWTWLFSLFAK